MKKKIFIVITSIAAIITVFVVFFPTRKKTGNKQISPVHIIEKFANDSFKVRKLTDIKYERTAERLKNGEYLANSILMCFTCHSPRNWDTTGAPLFNDKKGSGGTIVNKDSTSLIIAPNITPDKETGAGTWTDDMLARSIREGVGHDGRALSWQMPYMVFRKLSDEDLASVIVYLRSLPAIHNVVPPTKIPASERSLTEKFLTPLTEPVPTPDLSNAVKRGMYLVSIGECVGCHTAGTDYNPGLFAGGNYAHRYQQAAFTANLTSHPSGMSYGPDAFTFVMRTGKGGTLSPVMPWIAFKNMTGDDLKAIYAYLRTLPPSQHYVSNQKPFSHCAICGQEHGRAEKNKREVPTGVKLNPEIYDQYAGIYREDRFNSTYIITRKGTKLLAKGWDNSPEFELVPQSESHFIAGGLPLPLNFVKDKDGHIQITEDTDYGRVYKKIK